MSSSSPPLITTITAHYFPHYELSLLQRLLLVWAFTACGLVIVLQIAQSWADPRPQWTVVNEKSKQYWYTFYVLEAFLTMQISYRPLLWKLEQGLGLGADSRRGAEDLLDGLWIGLLGLEIAMVAGVVISRLMQMMAGPNPSPSRSNMMMVGKQKAL
ncbi:hypothetical protein SLS62_003502 [Diatrype stigma]|uniref:Uncharacterized protein n=1 Tax=Diatrype stigma TaxID=117547 RepID=A0AAN9UWA2_9PEZI